MKISIKLFGRYFTLCVGRKTPWFRQLDWFSITEEFYEYKEGSALPKLVYAVSICGFWREV